MIDIRKEIPLGKRRLVFAIWGDKKHSVKYGMLPIRNIPPYRHIVYAMQVRRTILGVGLLDWGKGG